MSQRNLKKLTEKERLLAALSQKPVDRPPVICPGGMMNAAVTQVISHLPMNHNLTSEGMVLAAKAVYEKTGFENYGVPFCMTCEAEPLNPHMDEGDFFREPKITEYVSWPSHEALLSAIHEVESKKCKEVLQAINQLKNDKIPVIGNITGPVSTATSIVDPLDFFKAIRKSPEDVKFLLNAVQDYLIHYAEKMIENGADVIVLSDPTATGEILGRKYFETLALPLYEKFAKAMEKKECPWIIHICGDITGVFPLLVKTRAQCVSFDAMISMKQMAEKYSLPLMGNINTQLLQNGPVEKIKAMTENLLQTNVSIVSPACGLGMSTPLEHLLQVTETVKRSEGGRER